MSVFIQISDEFLFSFLLPLGPLIAEARFGQFSTGFLQVFYQFSTWGLGPGASSEAVFFQFSPGVFSSFLQGEKFRKLEKLEKRSK